MKEFLATYKMDELRPISHKKFNKFIKGKEFKGRKDYTLKDLKAKFGFKPLVERRALVVSSNDMEPTEFHSMREATKVIGMGERVIRYARNNGRDFMRKIEDESITVFFLKQC